MLTEYLDTHGLQRLLQQLLRQSFIGCQIIKCSQQANLQGIIHHPAEGAIALIL